jgi:hypothetical protein
MFDIIDETVEIQIIPAAGARGSRTTAPCVPTTRPADKLAEGCFRLRKHSGAA